MHCASHPGPLALIDGEVNEADLALAARIVARYGKAKTAEKATVSIHFPDGRQEDIEVAPMPPGEITEEWML